MTLTPTFTLTLTLTRTLTLTATLNSTPSLALKTISSNHLNFENEPNVGWTVMDTSTFGTTLYGDWPLKKEKVSLRGFWAFRRSGVRAFGLLEWIGLDWVQLSMAYFRLSPP